MHKTVQSFHSDGSRCMSPRNLKICGGANNQKMIFFFLMHAVTPSLNNKNTLAILPLKIKFPNNPLRDIKACSEGISLKPCTIKRLFQL